MEPVIAPESKAETAAPVAEKPVETKAVTPVETKAVTPVETKAEAPVETKTETGAAAPAETKAESSVKIAVKPEGSVTVLLFKTPSCPNCKAAGAILDKAGVEYEPLNANEERELVKKFGIKQAPTLVLVNGNSFEKYRGVSDIKGWLMHK